MNWALEALELESEADERAIKRAYAKLLRDNRPDENPEGFQRLHEAYQTALQWQRYRQETAEEQENNQSSDDMSWSLRSPSESGADIASSVLLTSQVEAFSVPHQDAAAPSPIGQFISPESPQSDALQLSDTAQLAMQSPPIDIDGLVERIVNAARSLAPDAFNDWLSACPELWSIATKSDAGAGLLARFWSGSDAINGANFDLLANAFGWDEIGTHVDPDSLRVMATSMHQRWIWQAGNEAALAWQLQTDEDAPATLPEATLCRTLLSRPWRHMQALLSAVNPSRLHMMRSALRHVGGENAQLPSPPLCERQIRFWRDVTAENRLTRDRVLLGLVRGSALAMLWLMLPLVAYLMKASDDLKAGYGWPSPGDLLPLAGSGTLFVLLLGMGLLPWALLLRWLISPVPMRILLASMALTAMLLGSTKFPAAGAILGGATLWLAARRIALTSPRLERLSPLLALGIFIAAPYVLSNTKLSYAALTGLLTLALCVFDLGRSHRSRSAANS